MLVMENQKECSEWLEQIDRELETMQQVYYKNIFSTSNSLLKMTHENILILKEQRKQILDQIKDS